MAAAGAPPVDLAALERAAEAVLGSAAGDPAARAAAHAQLLALGESLSTLLPEALGEASSASSSAGVNGIAAPSLLTRGAALPSSRRTSARSLSCDS